MTQQEEETFNDVISYINSSKAKGKKEVRIKVFQAERYKTKKGITAYKNIQMKAGFYEDGDCTKELKKLGYKVSFDKTERQATSVYKNGECVGVNVKPLLTTNMRVEF